MYEEERVCVCVMQWYRGVISTQILDSSVILVKVTKQQCFITENNSVLNARQS